MKALHFLFITALLFSTSTHASLITLESKWCCGGPASIPGTLTFTYDDSTPDSVDDEGLVIDNDNPQFGSYQNAIVAATYVVTSGINNGKTFTLAQGSTNSILIRRYPSVFGPASVIIDMNLFDGSTEFDTWMRIEGIPPATDDLSELPLTIRADDTVLMIGDIIPLTPILYANNRVFNQVVTTPLPTTAWLFGSCLLGLVGFSRKRKYL